MKLENLPFSTVDWAGVEAIEHPGETGAARWRTMHLGDIRLRIVEYTPGYLADHWCTKGHVLFCLGGSLRTTLQDGRTFTLTPGMSYHVADDVEPHRSETSEGATLFVVD